MRTIRASEIGSYMYCKKAWWYQQRGEPSENQIELDSGTYIHMRHGKAVLTAGLLRIAAYLFFLLALLVVIISLLMSVL